MSRRSFVLEKIASCATSGIPRKVAAAATQRSASWSLWPRPWPFFTHHERNST